MKKWEIYLANVPFEDTPEAKVRPVIVLKDSAGSVECIKMTGHAPRAGEYVLKHWAAAGLRKETTVRISKRLIIPQGSFLKKIGDLHPVDILEIQSRLSI